MPTLDLSISDEGPNVVEGLVAIENCFNQLVAWERNDLAQESGVLDIDAEVATPEDILAAAGLAAARVLAVRVLSGGPLTLVLSSSAGNDQVISVSDLFVWVGNTERLTGARVAGVGQLDFYAAGEQ